MQVIKLRDEINAAHPEWSGLDDALLPAFYAAEKTSKDARVHRWVNVFAGFVVTTSFITAVAAGSGPWRSGFIIAGALFSMFGSVSSAARLFIPGIKARFHFYGDGAPQPAEPTASEYAAPHLSDDMLQGMKRELTIARGVYELTRPVSTARPAEWAALKRA